MSVTGLCDVCQDAEATNRCEQCGALVCSRHYDESRGACVECARGGGGRRI